MQSDLPKQYLLINKKPIFIYSVEAFAAHPGVDSILLAVNDRYYDYAKKLLDKYCPKVSLTLINGGEDRLATLKNILRHLRLKNAVAEDTILITHDAVRPFLDSRIITENIAAAERYGACDTVVPATDTIVASDDGEFINACPPRDTIFHGQTPQTFQAQKLFILTESLTETESKTVTDACSIFTLRGQPVKLVRGRPENIKITYPQDMIFAEKYAQTLKKP
jgi:2-C-methyl-D-erythritol 4-phosphate cytidylyltransferase